MPQKLLYTPISVNPDGVRHARLPNGEDQWISPSNKPNSTWGDPNHPDRPLSAYADQPLYQDAVSNKGIRTRTPMRGNVTRTAFGNGQVQYYGQNGRPLSDAEHSQFLKKYGDAIASSPAQVHSAPSKPPQNQSLKKAIATPFAVHLKILPAQKNNKGKPTARTASPDTQGSRAGQTSYYNHQTMQAYKPNPNDKIVRNNNVDAIDLTKEYFTGSGPKKSVFIPGQEFTNEVQNMKSIQNVRNKIIQSCKSGTKIEGRYDFNYRGYTRTQRVGQVVKDGITIATDRLGVNTPENPAASFLGSYHLYVKPTKIDKKNRIIQVDFHLWNDTSVGSLTRDPINGYKKDYKPLFKNKSTGPLSTTTQDVFWSERIRY